MIKDLRLKFAWKFWELAYSASWCMLGDLPFTWQMKDKRNSAFFNYNLNKRVK